MELMLIFLGFKAKKVMAVQNISGLRVAESRNSSVFPLLRFLHGRRRFICIVIDKFKFKHYK
jgi:hypothetical protein